MQTLLALDISSTCTGYSVFEFDKSGVKLVHMSNFKPVGVNIFEKLDCVKINVTQILDKYKPDIVAIEDIAQFIPGKSTAHTIITLGIFNRFIAFLCYERMNKQPIFMSVLKIRHCLKLTKVMPKKFDMPRLVEHHLNITFPYIYKKGKVASKNPDSSILKPETYDMADSACVGLAYIKLSLKGAI
jgi:hypothetical protein